MLKNRWEKKRIECVARFIDKYETITFVFPSEVSVEYPRRGYNGFFEWFTCGKADSETVAWEGLVLTWCIIHSVRRTIVFIVFLFPDVMKFYCDVYCVCLLHQVRAEGLWMAIDLISVFSKTEPFSSPFPCKSRLFDFFFDTEYYAILMSNPFILLHFSTLARPLQFLLFCFLLKTN